MADRLIQGVQGMKPWQMVLVSILASEILTGAIVASMEFLLNGVVTYDFIITGAVAALIVSFLIVAIIVVALNRLRENEARFRKLFESESSAVMVFDAETLRIEDANPACLRLYGYTKEEFFLLTPKDISGEVEKTGISVKAAIEGKLQHVPLRYQKKKDGTVFPAEIYSGSFLHQNREKCLGVIIDHTEMMKAEEAIQEGQERYRQLFQQATDYILVMEPDTDGIPVITDASDSAFEKHGYTREELIGESISFLDSEESQKGVPEKMRLIKQGGVVQFESEHVCKNGDRFVVDVSAKMIMISGKPVIYTIERDVTERKELERQQLVLIKQTVDALQEAQLAREKAEEGNRLKSEFLANMSHELNTPLSSVLGFSRIADEKEREISNALTRIIELIDKPTAHTARTELLAEIRSLAHTARECSQEASQYDNIVVGQGQRLYGLLNDIMDLSLLESGQASVEENIVSTFVLLTSVENNQKDAAKTKGLTLSVNKTDFRPTDLAFRGDSKKLEKVLNHLVQNAIKYSNEGSVRVTVSRSGENIVFLVQDDGIGILGNDRKRIFDSFRQLDGSSTRQQGGVGVGLALVKKLIEAMGGDVSVESEIGKGSEFRVTLPYRPVN